MNPDDLKLNLDQMLRPEVNTIGGIMEFIVARMLFMGGVLMVIAVIYSGIMYITAGGEPAKAAQARKNLVWAITGFIIILLFQSIIVWVPNIITKGTID